ncbi:alanyl-tRNA editing protein [Candidatus Woesearchaeota archaeon]|nr:MAG: alanyl-tRNA editing protein [Candidatus Woesearchaeota archaeon]
MRALYLDDSYLKEFESVVKEVNQDKFVVLENTAFYPNGGGQPYDTGKIISENGKEYKVVFVGKFSGQISHEVDKPGLKVGDRIKGIIDWERRYRLMRMHTASHIIANVFHNDAGAKITGNQLGIEKSRVDFSLERFDRELINNYIKKANEIIKRNLEVSVEFVPREEAEKDPSLFKLAMSFPHDFKELRIVSIGDVDRQCDGGTHVKNTSEIGTVELVKLENKGKNNRRVYFTLS